MMFGSAESEHPRLMVKLFRMYSITYVITIHQRYRQTDRQTDGRTDRRHAMAIPRFALKCIAAVISYQEYNVGGRLVNEAMSL